MGKTKWGLKYASDTLRISASAHEECLARATKAIAEAARDGLYRVDVSPLPAAVSDYLVFMGYQVNNDSLRTTIRWDRPTA
jgi:hypothetical protein